MNARLLYFLSALAFASSCATNVRRPVPWNQLYADPHNTGFNIVRTIPATSKRWVAQVGELAFSSPVIGPDGTVYVGNFAGQAVAVNRDGTVRWRHQLGSNILSTPVVHDLSGEIFFLVQNPVSKEEYKSFLYRISPAGAILAVSTTDLFSNAAPKIWRETIFLQAERGGLFAFNRSSLQLIDTVNANPCWGLICIGEGFFDWFTSLFDFLGLEKPPRPTFGPIHLPSPVIVDSPQVVDDPDRPLVITTTPFCATGWRFDRFQVVGMRFQQVWTKQLKEENCDKALRVTSPGLLPGNQIVVVNERGVVRSLDAKTGSDNWQSELVNGTLSQPAAFLRQLYFVEHNQLTVLDSDGALMHQAPFRGDGHGIALSVDYVYVATSDGLYTFNLDPTQGPSFDPNTAFDHDLYPHMARVVIGSDGTLYVATPDGKLHAYSVSRP